jgi:hypothetical protein
LGLWDVKRKPQPVANVYPPINIFEVNVAGTEEIRFWIMKWGANAQVLEPES